MPAAVVKTRRDEELWEKAKERVREEYGLSERDGERYWQLVMGIFRRMKGLRKGVLVLVRKPRRRRLAEFLRVLERDGDWLLVASHQWPLSPQLHQELHKAVVAVRAYQRRTPSGQVVQVKPHQRHVAEAPRGHRPNDLASRYGREVQRSVTRAADDTPLLVRQFGSGKRRAYSVHAPNGEHIATLHVETGPTAAQVTGAWIRPDWKGRGTHGALLRRLIGEAGEVHVPARLADTVAEAMTLREAGHPVRATGSGYSIRAAGERPLFDAEQSGTAGPEQPLRDLRVAGIEGQGVGPEAVRAAANALAKVMMPLRRFGIDGAGRLRVVVRGEADTAEYEQSSTTIFIGQGNNSLAHEVGHFVAHGLMEGWFGERAHPAELIERSPALKIVRRWMLEAVGHLPRGRAWASNPQEVWAVAFEAWANGQVRLGKVEMPEDVVRQARVAVKHVLEALRPRTRQGQLFKGVRAMLVAFGRAARLLKARVRGYYRTDPRTGKRVYVRPYERNAAHQLQLPFGEVPGGSGRASPVTSTAWGADSPNSPERIPQEQKGQRSHSRRTALDPAEALSGLAAHATKHHAVVLRQALLAAGSESYRAIRRAGYTDLAHKVAAATEAVTDWLGGRAEKPGPRAWKLLSHPLTLQRIVDELVALERRYGELADGYQRAAQSIAQGGEAFLSPEKVPEAAQQTRETAAYWRALQRAAQQLAESVSALTRTAEQRRRERPKRSEKRRRSVRIGE